ncbi:MAG: chorismate synthase [Nonlabens sp.]|uniref:chorismate synthase n=1 Tax=Nonlabens sp. TaxID=1888209 RepID=UPI00321B1ACF
MIKKILIAICIISIVSCDSSDDEGSRSNNNFNYLPLTVNNNWEYEVKTGTDRSTETLTVSSVTGNEYTCTSNPTTAVGFMTQVLTGGTLRAESGKLIGNGTIDFGLLGLNNFNVAITEGTLYDQNANPRTTLYSTNGTTSQTLQGFDINFNYEAKTVQQANVSQMTVEGVTYTDVIHSQLIINATVTTEINIVVTQQVPLLNSQDIIVIDNYWAKDIGLIKSDNQLDYMLEDFSSLGLSLPVPQSASILTEQSLTSFTVN